MKEENIKKLKKELNYLIENEADKEIEANLDKLGNADINIKGLAKEIYLKRGIDITKIKPSFIDTFADMIDIFKNQNKDIKKKMGIEIAYIIILIILMKIPVDLVRDIGYEYIEILSTKTIYYNIWNLIFLIIYTIIALCSFIISIRNFNKKYGNTKIS